MAGNRIIGALTNEIYERVADLPTLGFIALLEQFQKSEQFSAETKYAVGQNLKEFLNSSAYDKVLSPEALPASLALFALSFYTGSGKGMITSGLAASALCSIQLVKKKAVIDFIDTRMSGKSLTRRMLDEISNDPAEFAIKGLKGAVRLAVQTPVVPVAGAIGFLGGAAVGEAKYGKIGRQAGGFAGGAAGARVAAKTMRKVVDTGFEPIHKAKTMAAHGGEKAADSMKSILHAAKTATTKTTTPQHRRGSSSSSTSGGRRSSTTGGSKKR